MQNVGFLKLIRSDKTLALMGDPTAFTLASVIAFRAQRTTAFNIHGLEPGEALLGDHARYGMSERQYRTAKKRLAAWAIATFRDEPGDHRKARRQRRLRHQLRVRGRAADERATGGRRLPRRQECKKARTGS